MDKGERLSMAQFLWSVVWREASNVTRVIQTIAVTIPFVLTIGYGFVGVSWSRDLWPASLWGAVTVGTLFLVVVWGIFKRAYDLERDLLPKLEISDPKQHHEPWTQDAALKAKRHWFITITSVTTTHLTNVSVQELKFVNALGRVAPESGRYFPLSAEGQSKGRVPALARLFDLRGKGTESNIDICAMDETAKEPRVLMKYATPPLEYHIHQSVFPHTLTVRVTADQLPEPIDKAFRIYVTDDGFLRMETVSDVTRQAP
jgi:hypothetical protein